MENTYQEESSDEGKWEYKDSSCRKQRKLSWLEKTLWNMYQVQSDSTIEWLSTSRNTLVAANDTVSTLQANATPNYDSWFAPVNRYLRIAQGVLVAAAAISLIVLSARIVWNIGQGGEGRLLDRIGARASRSRSSPARPAAIRTCRHGRRAAAPRSSCRTTSVCRLTRSLSSRPCAA